MASIPANSNIKHVFVLMLENRSFDHMLGFSGLKGTSAETGKSISVEGINNSNSNSYDGIIYPATGDAGNIMGYDPGHEFPDVLEQLCGAGIKYNGGIYPTVNNSGFVINYATTTSPGEGGAKKDFGEIMKCYGAAALPVLNALAEQFVVCDHWYASLPGPTWPNRFFAHAASSGGLDHSPRTVDTLEWEALKGFSFAGGTIYDRLDNARQKWRIYHGKREPLVGSIASVAALKGIHLGQTNPYENFAKDVNGDYPYAYTFIEPNYGNIINNSYAGGTSQHPMDDVRSGEGLIKSTYEAIRSSRIWPSSLFIITYDEHGGFYDHVQPPAAPPPGDTVPHSKYNQYGFGFDRYGPRVPALVISAYTPKSTISQLAYDHSSIPASLENIFKMPALTKRDAKANNICTLASLSLARTDTPEKLPEVPISSTVEADARANKSAPASDSDPVDGGNLPGFLYVVLKAKLEQEQVEGNKYQMLDDFTGNIKTRADAKKYMEENLPGLMSVGKK